MSEVKRVNIRVSAEVYEYFKQRSEETGVASGALMFLALEQYMQQQKLMPHVPFIVANSGGKHDS